VTNVAPTATITPPTGPIAVGASVQLAADVHDAGAADTFTYSWTVSRNGLTYGTSTSATPNFTLADAGDYMVSLVVTDDDGAAANPPAQSITIHVEHLPPVAVITGGDRSVVASADAVIDASGSTGDTITSYSLTVTTNGQVVYTHDFSKPALVV